MQCFFLDLSLSRQETGTKGRRFVEFNSRSNIPIEEVGPGERHYCDEEDNPCPDGSILLANEAGVPGSRNNVFAFVQRNRKFVVGRYFNRKVMLMSN